MSNRNYRNEPSQYPERRTTSSQRYYSHRRNPVHRAILCGLFRLGRGSYRHRRETASPLLRLFGIQPRRSNYASRQYYAPGRGSSAYGTPRTNSSRTSEARASARSQAEYGPSGSSSRPRTTRSSAQPPYTPADQGGYPPAYQQGSYPPPNQYPPASPTGRPMTVAERHAAQYRQRGSQSGYDQGGAQPYPPASATYGQPYSQPGTVLPGDYPAAPQTSVPPRTSSGQYKRTFHESRPSQGGTVHSNLPLQSHGNQQMQPLPRPTGRPPYHLMLSEVLPPEDINAIERAGRMLLHIAGDTGGVKAPESQQIVAMAMETQFNYPDMTARPAFFYHLGDVVYYFGQPQEYYPQFYDAYVHYPAPIFAIPGNHDGDMTDGSPPSLTAFVNNFCAPQPHVTKEAGETARDAMTQPNVYWTLDAPFLNVIGLYSNVPEGGRIDNDQLAWFINELRTAPTNKALFLAVHHPVFSSDVHHSGSSYILKTLDYAFQQSGRTPDMIFTAHVHNYQRFTRVVGNRHVPYIVSGAGGYWHLHYMAHGPDGNKLPIPYKMPDAEVTLENYCDDRHGFLRMMVTPTQVVGEYYGCSRPQESWRADPERLDSFALDLRTHKLVKGTDLR